VEIPFHLGLAGHSDADVLVHALGDALLGAVAAGDLGRHFPDSDPAYKNISSLVLLEKIMEVVKAKNFRPVNVDAVIVAEAPRLVPHFPGMIARLAPILELSLEDINLKATTTEQMGFAGKGEGIAAYAVVLVEKQG
jgi:2-C-methyl-D-erythritol 2,4-cyclodiphosphate synthase